VTPLYIPEIVLNFSLASSQNVTVFVNMACIALLQGHIVLSLRQGSINTKHTIKIPVRSVFAAALVLTAYFIFQCFSYHFIIINVTIIISADSELYKFALFQNLLAAFLTS